MLEFHVYTFLKQNFHHGLFDMDMCCIDYSADGKTFLVTVDFNTWRV